MKRPWLFAQAVCLFHATALIFASLAWGEDVPPQGLWGTETPDAQRMEKNLAIKKGTMGQASHAMIAACHDRSVDIGLKLLQSGGNAVDAFIAVTFADYVQTPGFSSIGGPLGVMVYDAKQQKCDSLVAPLKTVQNPSGQWRAGETAVGKSVLVPGAVAGLESLHRKYGKLPWSDLVTPAAQLARDGFPIDQFFVGTLHGFSANIKRSDYGRKTFYHSDGTPLGFAENIELPVLADTLDSIAKDGASFLYKGRWAEEAVKAIGAEGGKMSLQDLSDYRPEWSTPVRMSYRGHDVYGLNGHISGGARLLLALKVLGHTDIRAKGHYSESLDGLETMIRVARAVNTQPELFTQSFFDQAQQSQELLDGSRDDDVWYDIINKIDRTDTQPEGSHSYCVAVVDADGNAVTGTHTIESLPFGSGIFVGGVPLNNTGTLHPEIEGNPYTTPPNTYIIEPFSATLAFKDKQLKLACSTFNMSLWPADFQVVVSALDFDWSPERIALTPRFGSYPVDLEKMAADLSSTWIDQRYYKSAIEQMKLRGLSLSQKPIPGGVDTGMLIMIKRDPATGQMTGFTPEQLPDGKASGY